VKGGGYYYLEEFTLRADVDKPKGSGCIKEACVVAISLVLLLMVWFGMVS